MRVADSKPLCTISLRATAIGHSRVNCIPRCLACIYVALSVCALYRFSTEAYASSSIDTQSWLFCVGFDSCVIIQADCCGFVPYFPELQSVQKPDTDDGPTVPPASVDKD